MIAFQFDAVVDYFEIDPVACALTLGDAGPRAIPEDPEPLPSGDPT
jgi:hypothetical protein